MKILIVNHYALPPNQPGGTRHFSLARALQERGHEVAIAASGFDHVTRCHRRVGDGRELVQGVPFHWLAGPAYRGNGPGRLWNMLVFARAVRRRLLAQLDWIPDVVVGSSPHLFGAQAALRLARQCGRPFVMELRDVWPQSLVEVMGVSRHHPLIWVMERIERELYREAAQVISLLPAVAARLVERGGRVEGLTWVPNGIDLRLLPPPSAAREAGPFTFMYAGAHGVTNALDVLVEAAALLQARPRRGRTAQLVLVGTGPEKPRLQAKARALGLDNLIFLPAVPKCDIYGVLAEADAFLVSSRDSPLWEHGISFNKLFDFMAMERPTVAGLRCPGNPIAEARCGLTVAPGDPAAMAAGMEELLALEPGARREMARRGRAHVEAQFDLRVLAGRFEAALEAALAGPAGCTHAG
jgi:glycosyltransferase involved in cell wall biosynthesis